MLEMFMLGKSCRMFLLVPILLVSVPGSQKNVNFYAFLNGELGLGDTEARKAVGEEDSEWKSYSNKKPWVLFQFVAPQGHIYISA